MLGLEQRKTFCITFATPRSLAANEYVVWSQDSMFLDNFLTWLGYDCRYVVHDKNHNAVMINEDDYSSITHILLACGFREDVSCIPYTMVNFPF